MAVPKHKVTRRNRGNRRAGTKHRVDETQEDSVTGEMTRRHHVTPRGYYRGEERIKVKVKQD